MEQFFFLKYLNALEVVGFMIAKRNVTCRTVPMGGDRYRVMFPSDGGHGEAAKRNFVFLRNVPIQQGQQ